MGSIIALFPDERVSEILALPGGEEPSELHVTLAYIEEDLSVDDVTEMEILLGEVSASHNTIVG